MPEIVDAWKYAMQCPCGVQWNALEQNGCPRCVRQATSGFTVYTENGATVPLACVCGQLSVPGTAWCERCGTLRPGVDRGASGPTGVDTLCNFCGHRESACRCKSGIGAVNRQASELRQTRAELEAAKALNEALQAHLEMEKAAAVDVPGLQRACFDVAVMQDAQRIAERPENVEHVLNVMWGKAAEEANDPFCRALSLATALRARLRARKP